MLSGKMSRGRKNVGLLLLCVVIKGASAFSAPVGALIGMGALKAGKTLCQVSLFVLTGVLAQRE